MDIILEVIKNVALRTANGVAFLLLSDLFTVGLVVVKFIFTTTVTRQFTLGGVVSLCFEYIVYCGHSECTHSIIKVISHAGYTVFGMELSFKQQKLLAYILIIGTGVTALSITTYLNKADSSIICKDLDVDFLRNTDYIQYERFHDLTAVMLNDSSD